ncbi:MAG: hypothetical protein VKP70_01025 [Cyanobacteriota bacterium]|nr:hypothetical protein [Cyanobacteriota bacterium]
MSRIAKGASQSLGFPGLCRANHWPALVHAPPLALEGGELVVAAGGWVVMGVSRGLKSLTHPLSALTPRPRAKAIWAASLDLCHAPGFHFFG